MAKKKLLFLEPISTLWACPIPINMLKELNRHSRYRRSQTYSPLWTHVHILSLWASLKNWIDLEVYKSPHASSCRHVHHLRHRHSQTCTYWYSTRLWRNNSTLLLLMWIAQNVEGTTSMWYARYRSRGRAVKSLFQTLNTQDLRQGHKVLFFYR
jgi:hypothetical protein